MTQKSLGKALGVKHGTVSSYEKGRTTPPLNKLDMLCSIFGVTVYELTDVDLSKIESSRVEEPSSSYKQPEKDLYNYNDLVEKVKELDAIVQKLQKKSEL